MVVTDRRRFSDDRPQALKGHEGCEEPSPLGILRHAIASELRIPKSNVYRIVDDLVHLGEVRPIPGTKNPVSYEDPKIVDAIPPKGGCNGDLENAPTMHNPTGPRETGSTIYRTSVLTVSVRTVHVLKGMLRPT